ncbi:MULTISPECIES: hypothetical protein [Streptacidiphilus]|uniref:Uncharacterized protein n=1 Tax=Streptacidiphilus cavernicola TaxID=3342716 RepID=A0ABV6UEN7_9ACTN|nr:hypothetical protein [Streptacidiphilus jeojiense]
MTTPTAGLSPRTVIQLPITRQLAGQYLGNTVVPGAFEPSLMWGLCSRLVDVVAAESGAQARAFHGLAEDEANFPTGDGLFVLRFQTHWPALFQASFGGQTTAGAARLDSTLVLPEPFLGTGYTKYAPAAVPEYWLELTDVPVGAEIWHFAEDGGEGSEKALARYPGRYTGWQSFPAAKETGLTSGPVAAPPAGSTARGLVVTFQGSAYLADFGPNPGEATVYRAADDGTMMSRALEFGQCDSVSYRRMLASWRDSDFEVLAGADGVATLALTSGNAEEAARLGLASAGRHAWRAQVPIDDLTEVRQETREITPAAPQA